MTVRTPGSASRTSFLTAVENLAMGTSFAELHTGYRAYSASSVGFVVGTRYGVKTLWVMVQFVAWRLGLARPAVFRP